MAPFYRSADPVALPGVCPGWAYGDFLSSVADLGDGLREAVQGGADFALVRVAHDQVFTQEGPLPLPVYCFGDETRALDRLAGWVESDPAAHGSLGPIWLCDPVSAALRAETAPTFPDPGIAASLGPSSGPLAVDLTGWAEAGAPPAWLVGAALGTVSEWLSHLCGPEAGANRIARNLLILVPVGTSFFPGLALLRTIRAGVRQVLTAFGADGSDAPALWALTDATDLARDDADTNLIRCTTAAMASAMGGADALSILPHDHHDGGSARGRRLARNISHLLREEAHLGRVADPAGGAWYVEQLTRGLGNAGWALFRGWEARGGLARCLGEGDIQSTLAGFRRDREQEEASGARIRVGVNRFLAAEESNAS